MKLTIWTRGLLSLSGLVVANWYNSPTMAQCVQADISVQYNISGSRGPTERNNDIEMTSDGACRGNATVTTGVQGNVGGNGKVRQNRVVRHRIDNRHERNRSNTYSEDSTVQIRVNPAIDVYNPADNLNY